jgi:Zn-dependent M16 (insulinase) family peptidase
MFELNQKEFNDLRSQFGTSSWGGTRYAPIAFTEHGVLMLSSVLNSEMAIKVNIQIMRIYTKIRQMSLTHKEILQKLDKIENKLIEHDNQILVIFEYLKQLEQSKREELERKPPFIKGYRKDKNQIS